MVQHFYITVKTIGLRVIQKTKNGKNRILQLKKIIAVAMVRSYDDDQYIS